MTDLEAIEWEAHRAAWVRSEDVLRLVAEVQELRAEREDLRAGYLRAESSYRGICGTLAASGRENARLRAVADAARDYDTGADWAPVAAALAALEGQDG